MKFDRASVDIRPPPGAWVAELLGVVLGVQDHKKNTFPKRVYSSKAVKWLSIIDFLSFIQRTGGRGYEYKLWKTKTSLSDLKTSFTDTSPVTAEKGVSYSSLSVSSGDRFDERHDVVAYKFWGFFKPPFTGHFNIMVRSDDTSEVQISRNGTAETLVKSFCGIFYIIFLSNTSFILQDLLLSFQTLLLKRSSHALLKDKK